MANAPSGKKVSFTCVSNRAGLFANDVDLKSLASLPMMPVLSAAMPLGAYSVSH